MLTVAKGCGFKNQGELLEEGPNRESLIVFGLSRNGNLPNDSLQSNFSIEKEKLIKDGLERKILSLETELSTAKQEIKNRENWLSEENTKRIQSENKLLFLEERIAESEKEAGLNIDERLAKKIEEIESLKKEAIDANKEKQKYKEWLDEKNNQLKIAKEKIQLLETELKKPEKTVTAPQGNSKLKLGKNERIILELAINHPEGIKQQQIIKETGIVQSEVSKCVRSLAEMKLVINQKIGIERLVKPVLEETEKPEVKPKSEPEIKQKVESALETLHGPEISLTKGLSLKELGIEPKEAEEFAEAVRATNLCHINGSPKDPENCFIRLKKSDRARNKGVDVGEKIELDSTVTAETQTAVILIEEFLCGERERLKAYFSTPSKFTKAKEEILEALKSGKLIGAEIFGSRCGVKKGEMPAVIALLCKEINADNGKKRANS